ncbi:ABC transporter ATP-binding protein [Anaerococcus sp. ENR0831]|uniref:ABC transporter ATP-binding protein n=1 Tax=Anaerococcus martiniensis TaxID=3115615 RepID=A0ABW9M5W0_9FIRM
MFKNFSWFFKYAKKNYVIGSISLILSDIISLFLPYVTGILIDLVYTGNLTMDKFIHMIAISIVLIILKYVTAIAWSYNIFKASALMEYTSRDKLMSKFLKQSQRFFENNPTGSLMSKSTQDVSQVAQFAGFGLLAFFDAALFPLFIIAMMIITIDFKMTIFSIIPFFALGFGLTRIMKRIYARSKAVNKSFDDLTDEVLEDVQGIRIIRVYNIGNLREQRFNKKARELANNNVNLERIRALIEPFEKVLTSLSFVIAVAYGSYLISKGSLSVGQLVSFTYYLNMLIWPMFAVGEFLNLHQQASAAMDRILEILNYKEEIENSENKKEVSDSLDIKFNKHSYKYPSSSDYTLNNINLKIDNGSSIGIIGKTGSGKTTLIRQLLDIYNVNKNSIIIGSDSYNNISAKSFKDKIGYVPQRHMIFSDTILNNIKFSNPNASNEEVKKAIEIADFSKDVDEFSEGLETLTGEKGVSLSGGQKQRLAIARAVIANPQILILDDAMSAVDANTEQNIINNLTKIRKDKTTIIIAHRISQVQNCDQIIVLEDGKIVDQGYHESLMSRDTWYKKQYENQISGGNLND